MKLNNILSMTLFALGLVAATKDQEIDNTHKFLLGQTANISADFEHERFTSFRGRTKTREGTAHFAKPGSFRWSYQHKRHGEETMYFDGKTLSHYIERDNTVHHYAAGKGQLAKELGQVVDMILNPGSLLERFTATESKTSGGRHVYNLSPRLESSEIQSLTIEIPSAKRFVKGISIEYRNGNRSTYRFENIKEGPIQPSTFKFRNPGKVKEKTVRT